MGKNEVLSAKHLTRPFNPSAKSLIQIKKRSEPRIEPCGTPALIPCQSEH